MIHTPIIIHNGKEYDMYHTYGVVNYGIRLAHFVN